MSAPNADPLAVEIVCENPAWESHAGLEALMIRALGVAAEAAGFAGAGRDVAVSLAGDALQQQLNREWRGKDSSTNVLSFPAADTPAPAGGPRPLGDIILAYETVAREAADAGRPFEAHATHLVVHGFLHLIGYDHETEPDAERMESLEIVILSSLGFDDPYDDDPRRLSPS